MNTLNKHQTLKITFLSLIMLISISGKAQDIKEDKKSKKANDSVAAIIAGKWNLEDFSMGGSIPPEQKAMMDSMIVIMKQKMFFDFDKSGKFDFKVDEKDSKGTWRVALGGTIFYTKEETKGEDKCTILKLTKNLFSFQIEMDGGISTFTLSR